MTPFIPHPFIKNPHLQTILASYLDFHSDPLSSTQHIPLPDGDILAVEVSTPDDWDPSYATVLMIHGLAGSHASPYLKRLTHQLIQKKVRAIRINLRGCGSGRGLAKKSYHGGLSEDIWEVIKKFHRESPKSPLSLIGFSLGGNIALKLAGENASLSSYCQKVIGICPSIHLEKTALRFQKFPNHWYEKSFLKQLKKLVFSPEQTFPAHLKKALNACRTLYEFDEIFTAPFWGFKNALDYYTQSSSQALIPKIQVPCQILFAQDDPLIDSTDLSQKNCPTHVEILRTQQGGHMGFLGHPQKGPFRWMDHLILKWLF